MSSVKNFQRAWSKYLPVIVLKLKSAVKKNESQVLNLDKLDFLAEGLSKSSVYNFQLEMRDGRLLYSASRTPLARDFGAVLNENKTIMEIIKSGNFTFSMNNNFVLTMQKIDTVVVAPVVE